MMMALEAGRAAGTVCEAAYGDMTAHFASALVRAEEGVASVTEWYRRNESTLSDMENCVVVGKGTGRAGRARGRAENSGNAAIVRVRL